MLVFFEDKQNNIDSPNINNLYETVICLLTKKLNNLSATTTIDEVHKTKKSE